MVHDTVFVSVYHDEQEEGLVNVIKEYFTTNGSTQADNYNGSHLSSKHFVSGNDAKCLCAPITIPYRNCISTVISTGIFVEQVAAPCYHAVDSPPPRA